MNTPVKGSGVLPSRLTTFIGRERESSEVCALLADYRCVTLTGSGGCGKTRLALHVATELGPTYGDGVLWVDLSPLSAAEEVPAAIADALEVTTPFGGSLLDSVAAILKPAQRLVLLDNCEHISAGCAEAAAQILLACPRVTILATSRAPLGVDGELLYRVPSLALPEDEMTASADAISSCDAVRLFVERAVRARHDFELTPANAGVVAAICRRLDGLPLALELAAARVRTRSLEQIASALEDRLRLLAAAHRNVVPRQRTLEASIEWSYELLDDRQRALFRRLAVFPADFTMEAAEKVVSGDGIEKHDVARLLADLVDQSLVEADVFVAQSRYRLLETIRAFAAERLSFDEDRDAPTRDAHLAHYRSLAERTEAALQSAAVLEGVHALRLEEANLSAALEWAVQSDRHDAAISLASSAYWEFSGRAGRPLDVLVGVLSGEKCPEDRRVQAALAAARLAHFHWDLQTTDRFAHEALEIARAEGDRRATAEALLLLGMASLWIGQREEAAAMLEEARALAEESGRGDALARCLCALGQVPFRAGDLARARLLFETGADVARRYGQVRASFESSSYLFLVHWFAGRDELADAVCDEGLSIARTLRLSMGESMFASFRAAVRIRRGELDDAERLLDEARSLAEVSGHPFAYGHWQQHVALLSRARGETSRAIDEFEMCVAAARMQNISVAAVLNGAYAAEAACFLGDLDRAHSALESVAAWTEETAGRFPIATWAKALLALDEGRFEHAEEYAHATIAEAMATDSELLVVDGLEVLGCALARSGNPSAATRILGAVQTARDARRWCRTPQWTSVVDDATEVARGELGAEAYGVAFAEGASLTVQDAVAYARRRRGERKRPPFGWNSLTPTEQNVAELVTEGLSNADIAARLFISVATVKSHLTHIYAKTATTSRVQLARDFAASRHPRSYARDLPTSG